MAQNSSNGVLILDNATTCAMRLKTLANIHGAQASIVHWNDWVEMRDTYISTPPCLIVIEQTVPEFVIELVVKALPQTPLFLLFSDGKKVTWNVSRPVTPLPVSLSNYEMMALLEPYWSEEACLALPRVFVMDDNQRSARQISQILTGANIQCQVSQQLYGIVLANVDLILVNISDDYEHLLQLEKVRRANPLVGIILYGRIQDFSGFEFLQQTLRIGVGRFLDIEALPETLLPALHQVWRSSLEQRDEKLVVEQLQKVTETLLEQSLMLQVLFASSVDAIVAFDKGGQIVKVNDSFAQLVGEDSRALNDSNIMSMLNQQSKQELQKLVACERLIQQQVLELRVQHKHSVHIPVSAAINRIHFHGESVFVAILRNVTAQHLQHKLITQKNAQLDYQAKESQKRERELIESTRQQQRARMALTEKISRIASNFDSMSSPEPVLKEQLLNIQRVMQFESGQLGNQTEKLNLREYVDTELAKQQELAQTLSVEINNDVSGSLPPILFDRRQLQQVLAHLIKNAILHNVNSGTVHISATPIGDEIRLIFADTGKGILEFKQAVIFDLYQSNLQDMNTLHTGLPLIKHIMMLNNGDIRCDNHLFEDKVVGSRFELYFATSQMG